jgi:hypothetical protein
MTSCQIVQRCSNFCVSKRPTPPHVLPAETNRRLIIGIGMEVLARRIGWAPYVLLLGLVTCKTQYSDAFYLPGVAPMDYQKVSSLYLCSIASDCSAGVSSSDRHIIIISPLAVFALNFLPFCAAFEVFDF